MSVFGIDLGTTNTCISRFVDGQPEVVKIDDGNTVPSVVAWENGQLLVGLAARNLGFLKPQQAIRSIKRKIGQPEYRAILGDRPYSAIEISTEILKYVAQKAAEACGEPVKKVVITVPAWFGDEQRRATMTAGQQAGLEVLRIINEPTAAALSYLTVSRNDSVPEQWMVYDLGGGTFDVSILKVNGEYKEVLASAGNTFLGGDDFDAALAQKLVSVIRSVHGIDPSEDPVAMAQLKYLAEAAKIALSSELHWKINQSLKVHGTPIQLDHTLCRDEFADLIKDLVESTISKVQQALKDAKVEVGQISRLLLVGGSTRIPYVQQRLQAEFKITPEFYVDPDLSVALGAGYQAALVSGLSCQQIVVDVCPHSLGIAALGDHDDGLLEEFEYPKTCAPIIFRNSRLPAKMSRKFSKLFPEQDKVEIVVLQGESSHTADNTLIGRFECNLNRSASMEFEVTFSYDANGIINIGVSQEDGKAPVREYRMDTTKSASWNSETPSLSGYDALAEGFDDDDDDEDRDEIGEDDSDLDDILDVGPSKVSNFLLDKIRQVISAKQVPPSDEVHGTLKAYQTALTNQEDDQMDELETKLYDWLEQREMGETQHGV